MKPVYICFSPQDEKFASRLVSDLRAKHIRVWLSTDLTNDIEFKKKLVLSDLLLLIVSPDSIASRTLPDEWSYFRDNPKKKRNKKRIILILCREIESLNYRLESYRRIDFLQLEHLHPQKNSDEYDKAYRTAFIQLQDEIHGFGTDYWSMLSNFVLMHMRFTLLGLAVATIFIIISIILGLTVYWRNTTFSVVVGNISLASSAPNNEQLNVMLMRAIDNSGIQDVDANAKIKRTDTELASLDDAQRLVGSGAKVVVFGRSIASNFPSQSDISIQFVFAPEIQTELIAITGRENWDIQISRNDIEDGQQLILKLKPVLLLTQAIFYRQAQDWNRASKAIEKVLLLTKGDDTNNRAEILTYASYLICQKVSLPDLENGMSYVDEALKLNPSYGRAFYQKGNCFYGIARLYADKSDPNLQRMYDNLYEAIRVYESTLHDLPHLTKTPDLESQLHWMIGNSYLTLMLCPNPTYNPVDPTSVGTLQVQALANYQAIVDKLGSKESTILGDMTAGAYCYMGKIYQDRGDTLNATKMAKNASDYAVTVFGKNSAAYCNYQLSTNNWVCKDHAR